MTEPVTPSAIAITALVSSITTAVIGVEFHPIAGALVGVLFAISRSNVSTPFLKLMGSLILYTIAAAMLGSGVAALVTTSTKVVVAICFVCGTGLQLIVTAAIDAMVAAVKSVIKKISGG